MGRRDAVSYSPLVQRLGQKIEPAQNDGQPILLASFCVDIVSARITGPVDETLRILRRVHDDWQGRGSQPRAQAADRLQSVDAGQQVIHENDVGQTSLEPAKPALGRISDIDLETQFRQLSRQNVTGYLGIIDNKCLQGGGSRSFESCSARPISICSRGHPLPAEFVEAINFHSWTPVGIGTQANALCPDPRTR